MYAIGSYVMLNRLVRKSTQLAVVLLNFICKVKVRFLNCFCYFGEYGGCVLMYYLCLAMHNVVNISIFDTELSYDGLDL